MDAADILRRAREHRNQMTDEALAELCPFHDMGRDLGQCTCPPDIKEKRISFSYPQWPRSDHVHLSTKWRSSRSTPSNALRSVVDIVEPIAYDHAMNCQTCSQELEDRPALTARWWRDDITPDGWRLATLNDYPDIPMKHLLGPDGRIRMTWMSLPPMTLWVKLGETTEGITVGLAES